MQIYVFKNVACSKIAMFHVGAHYGTALCMASHSPKHGGQWDALLATHVESCCDTTCACTHTRNTDGMFTC